MKKIRGINTDGKMVDSLQDAKVSFILMSYMVALFSRT